MKKVITIVSSIIIVICIFAIFSDSDNGSNQVKVNLDIEDGYKTESGEVVFEGTTDLIDDAILFYEVNGYGGDTVVKDGAWKVVESIKDIDDFHTFGTSRDENEFELWISFNPLTYELDKEIQPKKIYEKYGEGGANIKESDQVETFGEKDDQIKRVSEVKVFNFE